MKRFLCLILVFALMTTVATPCLAAEKEVSTTATDKTSVRYVWDDNDNCYRVTGNVTINGYQGVAYTTYVVSIYAEGLSTSTQNITHSAQTDAYVSFLDGTTINNNTLDSKVEILGGTQGTAYKSHIFTALINSIHADHYFWTDSGAYVDFGTAVLETSYY